MSENILICSTNWLGDSVMSMPAVQLYAEKFPDCRLTMLVKPKLAALWALQPCVAGMIELGDGFSGALKAARAIRAAGFDTAFVFPNSFRSALVPFWGGVPVRRGVSGHQRRVMLTDAVDLFDGPGQVHQAWEYVAIMGLFVKELPSPRLVLPPDVLERARSVLGGAGVRGWIGLMPGAAYGPAKRWPAEHFIQLGKILAGKEGYGLVVMGAPGEVELCTAIADGIGGKQVINRAGKTSLPELAALLSLCRGVVTNDSGGMHLASATGTKVAAIFGITDFTKTGPLGVNCRVIYNEGVSRSRDIERVSAEAEACLRAITPERVLGTLLDLVGGAD